MKTTVTQERNSRNKLTGRYIAKAGPFSHAALSKLAAIMELDAKLEELDRYEFTTRYLVTADSTVFALRHGFNGWHYDIIHTRQSGAVSASSCMLGPDYATENDAYEAMKRHWGQMESDHAPSLAVA